MVESTALEMRRACEGTVGSNPTLSAMISPDRFRGMPSECQHDIGPSRLSTDEFTVPEIVASGFLACRLFVESE